MTKYNNKKVIVDGITFDSKAEAQFYEDLKGAKEKGRVVSFEIQPSFILQEGFVRYDGKKILPIKYVADFRVQYPDGTEEVIDIKGMETALFVLKRKMFWKKFGIPLICLQYSKKYGERWVELEELKRLRKENKKGK
jgi:hypothetical protein